MKHYLHGLVGTGLALGLVATTMITTQQEVSPSTATGSSTTTLVPLNSGNSYKNKVVQSQNGNVVAYPVMRPVGKNVTLTVQPEDGYELESIVAVNDKNLPIVLTPVEYNIYEFEQPDCIVTISATFSKIGGNFSVDDLEDVAYENWFYPFVKDMVERGVMLGTSETHFEPDLNATRGSMAVIMANIKKVDLDEDFGNIFTDVSNTSWYRSAANWCVKNGVMTGEVWDEFEGDREITREELILALFNMGKYVGMYTHIHDNSSKRLDGFQDVYAITPGNLPGMNYLDAMSWGVMMGFIDGDTEGYLHPRATATRAEICVILSKFYKAYDFFIMYGS